MLGTDTQSAPKQYLPHGGCSGMFPALETMRKARRVERRPGPTRRGLGEGPEGQADNEQGFSL